MTHAQSHWYAFKNTHMQGRHVVQKEGKMSRDIFVAGQISSASVNNGSHSDSWSADNPEDGNMAVTDGFGLSRSFLLKNSSSACIHNLTAEVSDSSRISNESFYVTGWCWSKVLQANGLCVLK